MRKPLIEKARSVGNAAGAVNDVRDARQEALNSGRPIDKVKTAVKVVQAVQAVHEVRGTDWSDTARNVVAAAAVVHVVSTAVDRRSDNQQSGNSSPSRNNNFGGYTPPSVPLVAVATAVAEKFSPPPPPPSVDYSKYLLSTDVNEGGAREFLMSNKWPAGLQDTFIKSLNNIGFRFFIVDNSGSMSTQDGVYVSAGVDHRR